MSTQSQQSLRIFTIISQIEQALESAPRPKLGGGGRRVVDVDEIFDLLGDLKVTIPEDIRRANGVLIEADTLLEHANQEAVDIVEQAQHEADAMHRQSVAQAEQMRQVAEEEFEARVAEDKVMLEVQRRAELLQQHAERNAEVVYNGAKQYADEILQDVQRFLVNYQQLVGQNRAELNVAATQPAAQPERPTAPVAPAAAPKAAQRPVEPTRPQSVEEDKEEYADDFEEEPRRGLFGLFRRRDEGLFDDEFDDEEEIEEEQEPRRGAKSRRSAKHMRADDLDVDLDE